MATIIFTTPAGEDIAVEASCGSLMQAAVDNGVAGIDGDCGGVCSCATCHVQIDPAWMDKVGNAGDIEREMLEFEEGVSECSRLCCQIEISDALNGLRLTAVGR